MGNDKMSVDFFIPRYYLHRRERYVNKRETVGVSGRGEGGEGGRGNGGSGRREGGGKGGKGGRRGRGRRGDETGSKHRIGDSLRVHSGANTKTH